MVKKIVFLSFADVDAQKVGNLIPLLFSPEYDLEFYAVPLGMQIDSPEAEAIKRKIGEKIVSCNMTVCLISENTHNSKWVDLALAKNRNKGNRIIAMALKGTLDAVLPAIIKEENLTFYPWDPQRLKELIAKDTRKLFNNSL